MIARYLAMCVLAFAGSSSAQTPPLPSWQGQSREQVTAFVTRAVTEGGPGYIAPAERIAVFDNDGTLWSEQPLYFEFLFAVDRVKALASQHPEWKDTEPFASVLKGDLAAALHVKDGATALLAATHTGMTTDEFQLVVKEWLEKARHPTTKRRYTDMVYAPMLELLDYLRTNGFKTFIVSGGGIEFMRAFAEKAYGIPPEQVIGTSGKQRFELRDGQPVLVKLPELDLLDDGPGKPVGIQRAIGRRPVAAFGNSDGDLQMLQWTAAGSGPRFCLYVHHDDAEREWAYDRESSIGRLDKGLDEAKARGWTVLSIKTDWKTVHPTR